MPGPDSSYIAQVTVRIVRMFQRYAQNINPEDEGFLTYVREYLAKKGVLDPKSVPYSELYRQIKEAIRQYLAQQESRKESTN